mmetsp:Transcript_43925/g.125712  ORF Transcript_43925/g.125712 Transcript_43925/m.125712 type:complete len:218 (+) Transcript_43925:240-893(+)
MSSSPSCTRRPKRPWMPSPGREPAPRSPTLTERTPFPSPSTAWPAAPCTLTSSTRRDLMGAAARRARRRMRKRMMSLATRRRKPARRSTSSSSRRRGRRSCSTSGPRVPSAQRPPPPPRWSRGAATLTSCELAPEPATSSEAPPIFHSRCLFVLMPWRATSCMSRPLSPRRVRSRYLSRIRRSRQQRQLKLRWRPASSRGRAQRGLAAGSARLRPCP